jgi:hypothetical protein
VCFKDLSGAESSKKRAQGCLTFPGLATESLPHIEPVRDSEANVVIIQVAQVQFTLAADLGTIQIMLVLQNTRVMR